jgi:regulator of protease activity HflC (stomatin/prohibitin superfamily)
MRLSDESVMITGDGNLVELQATVRYQLDRAELHTYLFEVLEPEEIIRAATESVLRQAVASRPFLDLLTVHRGPFQAEVLNRLTERCRAYGTHGLGVRFEGLSLHDLHPPQEVVPAYHEVTKAMEVRDRLVNEAEAEALRKKREAEAQALQVIRRAQAAAHEKVLLAESARDAFLARLQARTQLGPSGEWRLFRDAAVAVALGQSPTEAYRDYQVRRHSVQATQKGLTDFRLYWDALARALTGRDKILIDAEKVPGRRQLFLFDGEPSRWPFPGMFPAGRTPAALPSKRGELRSEEQ